ncbi:MAG: glycosyltransferase family 39 protein [Actinomycetes bacterium]
MTSERSKNRRFLFLLLAICAGSAVFRMGYVAVAKANQPLLGDQIYYSAQAQTIADGRWFDEPLQPGKPAADHPPLTALMMTPAALVAPGSIMAQRYLMALYGAGVVALIGLLGRQVAGRRVGIFAAVLAAAYPGFWVNDALIMSETITAATLALAMIMSYRFADRATWRRALWMGAATGLAVLARAELVLLLPFVIVPLAWWARSSGVRQSPRNRVGLGAVALAAALIVQMPWVTYNLTRFDDPVVFSTNDGLTWIGANCENTYSGGGIGFWSLQCGLDGLASAPIDADQSVRSSYLRAIGTSYVRSHLDRVPAVVVARLARGIGFWNPDQMVYLNRGEGREGKVSWAAIYAYWALIPFALAGAILLRRRRTLIWPLVALVAISVAVIAAFYGIARFRLPAELAVVIFASVTFSRLFSAVVSRGAFKNVAKSSSTREPTS